MLGRMIGVCAGVTLGLLVSGCAESADPVEASPGEAERVVMTTFHPTTWITERLAGGLVEVECPLPEGEDPIFWRPSAEVIRRYQEADLIVVNGAELEKWVATAALPRSRVVDSCDELSVELITIESSTHSHGPAGEHSHDGIDGHTWVDPLLAVEQAERITEAMSEAFPEHTEAFETNLATLRDELRLLDAQLSEIDPAGVSLIASHPAYNYLSRRHGWEVESLDLDPEGELTDEDVMDVAAHVRPGTRGVLLWEGPPLQASAERLEQAGITSVVFSPAENPGEGEGDYLSSMQENIQRLRAGVGG
ncbi:MAG: metal ABC transporter substrate-binding protein [Phycisphaerales bacterium JB059]